MVLSFLFPLGAVVATAILPFCSGQPNGQAVVHFDVDNGQQAISTMPPPSPSSSNSSSSFSMSFGVNGIFPALTVSIFSGGLLLCIHAFVTFNMHTRELVAVERPPVPGVRVEKEVRVWHRYIDVE